MGPVKSRVGVDQGERPPFSFAVFGHKMTSHRTWRQRPPRCCEPADATDSSTNTEMPRDLRRRPFRAPHALVRDRGSQFVHAFDEIFRTEDFKILRTPVRAPVANAFAERWIGSIRRRLRKQPAGLPRTM